MQRLAVLDYYEALQLSPRAHSLVITKAYRLLAALYHPDNQETGNAKAFREVSEAYQVLSDPVRRAAYDRQKFGTAAPTPEAAVSKGPQPPKASTKPAAPPDERQLRQLVLHALYNVRRSQPHKPGLSLMVLAEVVGCSIDEMQFTLWYLRGKKVIEMPGSDDISITVEGVDHVEARKTEPERGGSDGKPLPPPSRMIESS